MSEGLLFFLLNSGVGVFWGVAVGGILATLGRKRLATALLYLLPLLSIGVAVWRGLFNPPIFAYDPFFGFFPGTIYDEVREITSTLVLYRLLVLAASLWWLATVALLAGRNGWLGRMYYDWHQPLLWQTSQRPLRERLEGMLGALALWSVMSTLLVIGFQARHTIGFRHDRASIAKALGGKLETANFTLIYDREAFSPRQIQLLARDHEYRFHQLVKFFGLRPRKKVTSFIFRNPAQKSKYMGAARTMIARPWAYEMYLHGGSVPHPVLKHELVHVFSAEFGVGPLKMSVSYGVLFHAAMVEGVAVAADGSRRGLSPHQWCKAMLNLRYKPSPARILNPTGFFRQSSLMAYKIAGSFSRYMIDTYGIEKYKRVYGRANFSKVYGRSLVSLGKEWRAWLRKNIKLNRYDQTLAAYYFRRYRSIFVRVCPHEVAALRNKVAALQSAGQLFAAIDLQKQLCRIAPRSYNHLQLARLWMNSGKTADAKRLLQRLLNEKRLKKRQILRRQIKFLLSTLLVQEKQPKRAFRLLQSLQKEDMSLYWKRLLWIRLTALKQGKAGQVLLEYLGRQSRQSSSLAFLKQAFQRPDDPVANYLLGRRFYYTQDLDNAWKYLRKAARYFTLSKATSRPTTKASSRPSSRPVLKGMSAAFAQEGHRAIAVEIERLCARILFDQGKYKQAALWFRRYAGRSLPSGDKRIALDWSRRALWEKRVYNKPVPLRP